MAKDSGRIVLRPGRLGIVVRLGAALVLAAVGVAMVRALGRVGWLFAGVGGFWAVVQALQMLPSSTFLALDREGFTARCLFREQKHRWTDIDRFGVSQGLVPYVAFSFVPEYSGAFRTRRLAEAIGGYERTLLSHYGIQPETLAELMNRHRERASEGPGTSDLRPH
jgi:hypothetical protein